MENYFAHKSLTKNIDETFFSNFMQIFYEIIKYYTPPPPIISLCYYACRFIKFYILINIKKFNNASILQNLQAIVECTQYC